jgi:hypothetical protein
LYVWTALALLPVLMDIGIRSELRKPARVLAEPTVEPLQVDIGTDAVQRQIPELAIQWVDCSSSAPGKDPGRFERTGLLGKKPV